ncbi:hypothetical protein QQS21_000075 [Conoideocrella luteorostrata]|uniref:Enoyl reductase (ER) domain-containing protein n=1 Tax=Conoideocrella luteorostrata TaxID=1105319 RepID=A0AAJ0G310_9HYPO|nr:hypothetical protein QQS21_000075 [Conoideocrella luteorostrata]
MTSKAWIFSARGDPPRVLSLTTRTTPSLPPSLPLPNDSPKPEEWLLIKVAFAGLNIGAIFQMTLIPAFLRSKSCIPEMDLSGTVIDAWHPDESTSTPSTATSNQARRFAKGDNVVAMLPASHALATGTGALAEYIAIPAKYAVRKPGNVSFADAAGCLLTGMTARQQVEESAVKKGDRVLVNAASGGIGSMIVQMVRSVVGEEGYVVGVCSGKNAELVKSLGADEIVDYTQHKDLPAHLATLFATQPFNAIIDTLGFQNLYTNSPKYLVPGGIFSSVGIKPPTFYVPDFIRAVIQMKLNEWWPVNPWLGGVGRLWKGVSMMSPTLEDRERIVNMLARDEIRVVKDSIWPFEKVAEAYKKLGGGHAAGKVLVKVDCHVGDDDC